MTKRSGDISESEKHAIAASAGANRSTRRTVIDGLTVSTACAYLTGCRGYDSYPIASIVTHPQPIPVGALMPVSVAVSSSIVGSIGPRFTGLSYDKLSM